MKYTILLVDDEKQILNSFKRLFIKTDYKILLASSGNEALDLLKNEMIDIIITDIKMPSIDGYTLLKIVKEKYPNTTRVILSGYTEKSSIINAINSNLAKLYILKPWNNSELISTINNILKSKKLLTEKHLMSLIEKNKMLITIPKCYNEVICLIKNNASIDQISSAIEKDQTITSKILKISNSAFYNTKTGCVKDALLYLGLTSVKNIILSTEIFDYNCENQFISSQIKLLWEHSSLTNKLTQSLYLKLLNKKIQNNYLTAGLLHDIGKVIFIKNYTDIYKKVLLFYKENNTSLLSSNLLEKDLLGISHSEAGAALLNWYGLPQEIVDVVRYHHYPDNKNIKNVELTSIVHIANYFSWKILKQKPHFTLNNFALELFSLNPNTIEDIILNLTLS